MIQRRLLLIGLAYCALILLLGGRLFQLQVVRGDYYRDRTENRTFDLRVVDSWRGNIVDRHGEILATDKLSWDLAILFDEFDNRWPAARALQTHLDLPRKTLRNPPESFALAPYWSGLPAASQTACAAWLADTLCVSSPEARRILENPALQLRPLRDAMARAAQERMIANLAAALSMPPASIRAAIMDKRAELDRLVERHWETSRVYRKPQPFWTGIETAQAEQIELGHENFPAVSVVTSLRRGYPRGPAISHVIGYVNALTAEEYEARRHDMHELAGLERPKVQPDDCIGRAGLEAAFEAMLAGQDGLALVERNAHGETLNTITEIAPRPGAEVRLTIDMALQEAAYAMFEKHGWRGALAAIDIRTGDVLALVTYPSFDNNWFIAPANNDALRDLFAATDANRERAAMVNRASKAMYPSGSTLKIAVAMAGLESGAITPAAMMDCTYGQVSQYGRKLCNGVHHTVDLLTAIQKSCNLYFYQLGARIGIDRLAPTLRSYGFGRGTGIETGDSAGLIGDRDWKRRAFDERWYPSETEDVAIGQGFVQVSPLQVARFFAAVAGNGRLPECRLVDAVDGRSRPRRAESLAFQPLHLDLVKRGMRMVCLPGGTAHKSGISRWSVAGKTGTAEVKGKSPHAWFAGFAPYENPEIAFAVIVEHAGHGGDIAAPLAARFLDAYFGERTDARADASFEEAGDAAVDPN